MITDELVNKTDVLKLRKMAIKLIDKIGDTNFHNRESINLKWVNLHNVFRKGPAAKVFSNKDFQLINRAAEAARVSADTILMASCCFKIYKNYALRFTSFICLDGKCMQSFTYSTFDGAE